MSKSLLSYFLCVMLWGGLPNIGRAQCVEVRTLLDSMYAVNLRSLNALRDKSNDTISGSLRQQRWPRPYSPLLLHHVFGPYLNQGSMSGSDSTLLVLSTFFYQTTVTRLAYQPSPQVRVAILQQATDVFLLTLREDLSLIDAVAFNFVEPMGYIRYKGKPDCFMTNSGLYADLTATGLLTQTSWEKSVTCKTGQTKKYQVKKRVFQLGVDGRFVPQ